MLLPVHILRVPIQNITWFESFNMNETSVIHASRNPLTISKA